MNSRRIGLGALAGLVGGVVFGLLMQMMGMMPMVASLVGQETAAVGWPVHLVISVIIGAGYGATFGQLDHSWTRGAGFGMAYGALWWVLGALVAMPALLAMPVLQVGSPQLMSLMGHLVFGLVTGLVFTAGVQQTVGEPAATR